MHYGCSKKVLEQKINIRSPQVRFFQKVKDILNIFRFNLLKEVSREKNEPIEEFIKLP